MTKLHVFGILISFLFIGGCGSKKSASGDLSKDVPTINLNCGQNACVH